MSALFQTFFIVSTRYFLSSTLDFSVNNSIFATSSSVTTPKYGVLIFAYYYYTHSGKRNCTRPSVEGSLKLYNSILYNLISAFHTFISVQHSLENQKRDLGVTFFSL